MVIFSLNLEVGVGSCSLQGYQTSFSFTLNQCFEYMYLAIYGLV